MNNEAAFVSHVEGCIYVPTMEQLVLILSNNWTKERFINSMFESD